MELVRRGWSVFVQHTPVDVLDEAIALLQAAADEAQSGGEVAAGQAELTVGDDREQLVEQILEVFGRIDMLVNAAPGVAGSGEDLLEMSEQTYRDVMDSGVTATLFLTQLVANEMVRLVDHLVRDALGEQQRRGHRVHGVPVEVLRELQQVHGGSGRHQLDLAHF